MESPRRPIELSRDETALLRVARRLGFANRTLGYPLQAKNRTEGAEIRGRFEAPGVIRASGHEHLNGSLVVPEEEGAARAAARAALGGRLRRLSPPPPQS